MSTENKKNKVNISVISRYFRGVDSENLPTTDLVERGGYVSPDVRIKQFMDNGNVLPSSGGSGYEIPGVETDLDPSSDEYVDELHSDAENFKEEVMPQFIDKISAVEVVKRVENDLEMSSKAGKKQPTDNEKLISSIKHLEESILSKDNITKPEDK